MPIENEDLKLIARRISERISNLKCPLCGEKKFQLENSYKPVSVSESPSTVQLGGPVLPSAIIICHNCGNTHFLNLLILGLQDLLSKAGKGAA